jgi:hypothetical protein
MFDAYRVAVKLSLVNGVSSGLAALALEFKALNQHVITTQHSVTMLEKRMKEIKTMGMVGGAMAMAGGFGLSLFSGPLEEAKKFQTEVAKFSSLGFGDNINRQAVSFANGMKTFGTSARDNMAIVGDAMAVFKDLNDAKMAAPWMAKMKFANEAIYASGGGDRDKKLMDMMKVAEFRGGTKSPEEFARQVNFAQQAVSGSRNRVDPSAMLQALKTGGVGLSQRSNEAFYLGAEPLIQEFGGKRYGTAAMSIYQNLVQSRGTITAQQELFRLGLLDPSKVQFNQLGMLKKALPGSFKGSGTLEKDGELALLEKVLLPAFAAKGITGDEDVIRELGMILGNRTGSSLMSRIYQQRVKLHMQTDANYHAENVDQAAARAAKTLAGKELDLHAKYRDVLKELGNTILPTAIKAVEGLTSVLKGVINFSREFPTLTKGLVIAFGILSGMVATGGAVLMATAAFRALGIAMAFNSVGGSVGIIRTASSLVTLSGGIYAIVGAVAAYAGYKAGGAGVEWWNKTLAPKGYNGLADWWVDKGGNNKHTSAFIAAQKKMNGGGNGDIYMDGKKVGEIVSGHQAKSAHKPFNGQSAFDMSMSPLPAGMRFAK